MRDVVLGKAQRCDPPHARECIRVHAAGARPYIYGFDGDVHIYDVTTAVAGEFQEIGTLTLAGIPDPGTNLMRMTISQDGHTLFIAGPAMVVVQPLP